jgi:hypothetical protein
MDVSRLTHSFDGIQPTDREAEDPITDDGASLGSNVEGFCLFIMP